MRERNAGIAQSVVRRIGSAEVTGPIPVASFLFCKNQAKKRLENGVCKPFSSLFFVFALTHKRCIMQATIEPSLYVWK